MALNVETQEGVSSSAEKVLAAIAVVLLHCLVYLEGAEE
jgi:hypothetical protein